MASSAYLRLKWKLEGKRIVFHKPITNQTIPLKQDECTDKDPELAELVSRQFSLDSLENLRKHATQVIKSITQRITQKILLPPEALMNRNIRFAQ